MIAGALFTAVLFAAWCVWPPPRRNRRGDRLRRFLVVSHREWGLRC